MSAAGKPSPPAVAQGEARVPKYMPPLDGLRAFACLAVLVFHLEVPFCQLGWSGVFLFFVISGFLITGILLDTKDREGYFRNFYIRRSLRIFPIYYLLLAAVVVWIKWRGEPLGALGWYVVYAQNILIGRESFSVAFPHWMNHTWTLAVEEQFYLLWPLCVFLLSRRALVVMSVSLIGVSILCRAWFSLAVENVFLTFTPLPCVVDSLAVGALLALLVRGGGRWTAASLARIGRWLVVASGIPLVALVAGHGHGKYWRPEEYLLGSIPNLLLFTLMAGFFGGVILVAVCGGGLTSRVLNLRFLRHIGRISYGLYLYHFPVFVWMPVVLQKLGVPVSGSLKWRLLAGAANMIGTYLVALASWHLVEKHCLALKETLAPARAGVRPAAPAAGSRPCLSMED
ncbi:MAG: acyltransferase [Verrucomicrobia bacterium]|nr:acyltransferase [Verrucomicrobiota bacterium]